MVVGMFLVSVYTDGCGHVSCFCLHRWLWACFLFLSSPMVVGMFLVSVYTDGCGHVSYFCLYRLTPDPMVVGMFLFSVYIV